ncbi:MAG: ABC transporter ATP-binding protein [Ilumatobacteraceae bacterium]
MTTALSVRDLTVRYNSGLLAVSGVNFDVARGKCLAVIGESGSGKSTMAKSCLGLLDDAVVTGSIRLDGNEVSSYTEDQWRSLRWTTISLAFQTTTALNPTLTVEDQIAEPLIVHRGLEKKEARARARGLLGRVGFDSALADRYPTQMSGGQRRMAAIAMAMVCNPSVIVLDEPTAGLDPLAREQLVAAIDSLKSSSDVALLVFSHDIALVKEIADDLLVLYAGWSAEKGEARVVLNEPRNPYSFGLLGAVPQLTTVKELRGIRSADPSISTESGCPFAARCTQAVDLCLAERPVLARQHDGREVACVRGGLVKLLEAQSLSVSYNVGTSIRPELVHAVNDVSAFVRHGEVLGIVGTNGAGKSTFALGLAKLLETDSGQLLFEGHEILSSDRARMTEFRRKVQLVQQDPFESLSPHFTVKEIINEPRRIQGLPPDQTIIVAALKMMRLPTSENFLSRRTHQLSGGQLQRLSIARALVMNPTVLILDEPVSMLDPSEQAEVLHLLKTAQVERGMSMIMIAHDIAVVMRVADRIAIMHLGQIVEEGIGAEILGNAKNCVTQRLLAAAGVVRYEVGVGTTC